MGVATSAYTMELRCLLCPSCGAPTEAALAGGDVLCTYCNVKSHLAPRAKHPAFAPPPPSAIPEPERLNRLRAQMGEELRAPKSIAALFPHGPAVGNWKREDVFAAWQSARSRTAKQDHEAAQELVFLTEILGNLYIEEKDWTRHRAILESALEAFFLPRHRSMIAADLCTGACRQNDLAGGETWLALCDKASEDLHTDTLYRMAVARVARMKNDYATTLRVLGATAGEVPIHDAYLTTSAVARANAHEHLGNMDAAVRELSNRMAAGPEARRFVELTVSLHGLCPHSFPAAIALVRERSARVAYRSAGGGPKKKAPAVLLGLLVVVPTSLVFTIVAAASGVIDATSLAASAAFDVVLLLVVIVLFMRSRGGNAAVEAAAQTARRLQLEGRPGKGMVLSVRPTGTVIDGAPLARLHVRVQLDGVTPYEADVIDMKMAPSEMLGFEGKLAFIRVDPNDPRTVAAEAAARLDA